MKDCWVLLALSGLVQPLANAANEGSYRVRFPDVDHDHRGVRQALQC